MKKILLLLLIPFGLFAQTLQVQSPVRFLALGDSYTIGQSVATADNWPNQLKDSLAVRNIPTDTLKIIATTGWRTDNLISAITNQGLDSGRFNLVSLLIGVNNQYQGTPFSQYVAQLPQLIDSALRYAGGDASHVFMISIPDYAYTPFGIQTGDTQMISEQIDTYNLVGRQFADSFHIKYFNITPISRMGLANPALVTTDGLHPSALQYSMWIKLMLQTIDSSLAGTDTTVTTGIATLPNQSLSFYPNPVKDKLTINFGVAGPYTVNMYDVLGQKLWSQAVSTPTVSIPMDYIYSGIYTVEVISASGASTIKVLKQ